MFYSLSHTSEAKNAKFLESSKSSGSEPPPKLDLRKCTILVHLIW